MVQAHVVAGVVGLNQPCTVICASMKLPSVNTFSIIARRCTPCMASATSATVTM
jgi:hypothetical protein